ncbi:hypothetical protein BFR04_09440 [Gaetbulibacter sp. 4G1]|nr:alpha/beta fold hydrolase [Gaetbulibacter sp. 4G1]PIA77651.1 hypothetical protein BFR04_09440 [Gaetbulibacter sp. 4G1]
MQKYFVSFIILTILFGCKNTVPNIIGKPVPIKNKTERIWKQGWISVEENRIKDSSNLIELPFILSKIPEIKKDSGIPILIMSGGPGNSSLNMANGIVSTKWGKKKDIIVLEQRGTIHSKPSLICQEIDSLRIYGLKKGLYGKLLDSLKTIGIRMCYERLTAQNIDLNGYNTLESIEDIEELRKALKLDRMILYGISYSCNLMTAYAQTYPKNVEALILDSPLPHIVNYDEEAFRNIDSTLMKILKKYSGDNKLYKAWTNYISSLKDSVFKVTYESKVYNYTKSELIDVVLLKMSSHESLSETTTTIKNIINGKHIGIKDIISYHLEPSNQALGMRYSLWIGEELSEETEEIIFKQEKEIPWLHGYSVNDVSFKTAKVWKVNSIYKNRKWPETYYKGPVLILSGQFDPWTPEWYGNKMFQYLPKAKQVIYPEKTHLPGFTKTGIDDINKFINDIKKN